MRKIISKQEEKRIQKRNQWIVGIILVFLMVTSTLGFAFQGGFSGGNNGKSILEYNGFEFENVNGFWTIGKYVFRYNPKEIEESVNLDFKINKDISDYSNKVLYIYSENSVAESEIVINLGQVAERIQKACPEDKKCEENIPIKTCENNFVIIEKSNQSLVSSNQGCVYIKGEGENLIKIVDKFLFKVLDIM